MMKEIGSEFHRMKPDDGHGFDLPVPGFFVFSGRTAIETVLKGIPEAKKALLPSYCCDSMIKPFCDAGISVCFYPVNYHNGLMIEVDLLEEIDIFFWCNYFGFNVPMPNLSNFHGVIIEDITHSLLSTTPYHTQSNFIIASLRKWEPIICGGYCAAIGDTILTAPMNNPPDEFVRIKALAMELKKQYLDDYDEEKKTKYLSFFQQSNHWLAENYSGLAIDPWSRSFFTTVDLAKQKETRRKNAKALYHGLQEARFLFNEEDMECPLFVPILLPNREEVRNQLIAKQIYCPVHWPQPYDCDSNIYKQELSLICDQRYNEEDMKRIVSVLKPLL